MFLSPAHAGHCITLDSPGFACSLKSYAVNCETPLSASTCRCFQARNESSEAGSGGSSGSGSLVPEMSRMNETFNARMKRMENAEMNDTLDMDLETCASQSNNNELVTIGSKRTYLRDMMLISRV